MNWDEQGCIRCRTAWASGQADQHLVFMGEDQRHRARLYQCKDCHAIWQELERYAHVIPMNKVKENERP